MVYMILVTYPYEKQDEQHVNINICKFITMYTYS